MKRVFFVFIIFFCFQNISAQYTDIINSKRPGFSESPYGVGTNVYQFEGGLFYIDNNNTAISTSANTFGGELFFRLGKFSEKLEINLNVAYQGDQFKDEFGDFYKVNGISELRIGAKYLLYQQEYTDKSKEIRSWKRKTAFDAKRLVPSVALYYGMNTNIISEPYKKDIFSLKGAVLLQNDLSDRLIIITNIIVDEILSDYMYSSYIITMTYAINQNWSFFVENVGKYQSDFPPEYQLGTGIAYLLSPDLQIDASVRTNIFDSYSYVYASTGVSWRLDRHQDSLVNNSAPKKTNYNKGFFSRLFGKN